MDQSQLGQEADRLQAVGELIGADGNYVSYEENKEDADALFAEEVAKGFAHWATDKEVLEQKYGKLVQSSIGVIVKYKKDQKKVRLVHDLRRSGVNSTIKFSERLVLPRLRDLAEDVMVLMENRLPGERVALMSLDYKDAFKQMPVRRNEKRCLSGQAMGGYFIYHAVLFGVRTGPLVWARMAALVGRISQSMFRSLRSRIQLYVDDPMVTMRGTQEQIHDMCDKILLLWTLLGLQISWGKGARGCNAEWIGANVYIDNECNEMTLAITEER